MDYSNMTKEQLLEIINNLNKKTTYGLNFERKPEKVVEECREKIPILQHVAKLDVLEGGQDHLLIEGDNYHSLLALQTTHREKVDVIYIDPPYNTGNKDFIYNDQFVDQEDGYKHSKWLSFMEPRLKLARNLLKDTGVIFISIDDHEMAQLKLLCDQIFGEGNFVACIPWRKRSSKSDVPFRISQDFEWILCYSKSNLFLTDGVYKNNRKYYETPDFPNNPWRTTGLTAQKTISERPNSNFTMVNPKNGDEFPVNPNRVWGVSKDTFEKHLNENKIVFPGDYDFLKISQPVFRYFKKDDMKKESKFFGYSVASTLLPKEVGMSLDGTKEIIKMFGEKLFNHPKPVGLIKHLLKTTTTIEKNATILDFFAGSGTTGHTVLEMNQEDGGNRKFILCTNNENNICKNITRQRLKKVIEGYTDAKGKTVEGTGGNLHYFKTNFISRSKNKDQMAFNLAEAVTDLLAIKEDVFYVEHQTDSFDILSTEDKGKHLCVYYDMMQNEMKDFVKILKSLNGEKLIYMLSLDDYVDEELFEGIKGITIKPIPKNILEIYNSVLPKENI